MKRRLRVATLFGLLALLLLSTSFALAAPPADKIGNASEGASAGPLGPLGMWQDNFDSYAAGSSIIGQGGWEGWTGAPAEAAFVDNAQSASAPNSLRVDADTDVVHLFNETTGIQLFSGKIYIPTAYQGQSYLIFLNTWAPTQSWSAQLLFDSATNTVQSQEFGVTAPFVRGQWMPWVLRVNLTTDTQTFTLNGTQVYANQPWSTSNGAGAVRIAAIDLFGNGASAVYHDDLMLMEEGAGPTATPTTPPAPTATATMPPTSIELGGISSTGSAPVGGWLISLLGLGLVAVGLIAKRRR